MRTSVPGIWAAGDCTATIQLTPVAAIEAQVAIADMLDNGSRRMDYTLIPTAIFTDPELASVGLTEAEAADAGFEVERRATPRPRSSVRTTPRRERPRPRGLVKLVYGGAHAGCSACTPSCARPAAHPGLRGGARLGATVDDLALGHYAFPTNGEGIHYAAEEAAGAMTAAAV